MVVIVKQLDSSEETHATQLLRVRVFVEEQGVPKEIEIDQLDESAIHAVAYEGDRIVGTGRLIIDTPSHALIGRMAVDATIRYLGVGSAVLAFLEKKARVLGIRSITLHAQDHARQFYSKQGYQPRGKTFLEAGIIHIEMSKEIT